jgi:hypothetical protein
MNLEKLLRWLNKHQIELAENRLQKDGSRVLTFTTQLPQFPHAGRHVWCTVVLSPGQNSLSESEIDTILRHCWHGELEIPKDYD